MMGATEFLEVILGGVLRLLLPVGITVFVAAALKRLDDRWRMQSLNEAMAAAGAPGSVQELHCWEAFGCKDEQRANCRASQNPGQPCWDCFSKDGQLQSSCKRCAFRQLKLSAAKVS